MKFKLLLIILSIVILIFAVFMFFKGMTGKVIYDDTENNTDKNVNKFSSGNETNNTINDTFQVVNKTNPAELNEGECIYMIDGKKLCLLKKGTQISAGEVNIADGQSG